MIMERLTPRGAILAVLLTVSGPASGQIVVRGPLAYDHVVSPGSLVAQEFDIENTGEETVTATLYQTDYSFQADGSNEYGEPGSVERSNAPWIRFMPSVATLEAGQIATVRYVVSMPETVSGSFWSMLMVEGRPGDVSSADPRGSVGLQQITRYGVQIATHVQDTGAALLEFVNGSLEMGDNGAVLSIDILNTGERMLRPGLSLRLVDPEGEELGPFQVEPRRLYPGTSIRARIPLPDVPKGQYSALLVADAGGDDVFGLQMDLTL